MAISHELNSEIVSALLEKKARSKQELEELRETLITVHATLQRLNAEAAAKAKQPPVTKQAAAGSSVISFAQRKAAS